MKAAKRPFGKRVEAFFWRHFNRRLPKNRTGDRISAFLWFVRHQRRWPRPKRMLFSDQLYAIKTSNEICNPLRVFTSDKEYVKLYVAAKIGDQHNVPTLAILKSFDECRRYSFPDRCVIKPTHMSAKVILRRGGEPVDMALIASWFEQNLYVESREANYRTLLPKVIVEPFVFDENNPKDYKIFCAGGRPALIQVDSDRHVHHVRSFYDTDWERQPFSMTYTASEHDEPRPANLELMLKLASKLSEDFSFVRIDFYSDGTRAVVGEITHCHGGTHEVFVPASAEILASQLLFEAATKS